MQQLVKAQLLSKDGGTRIEFMFNPTELNFSRSLQLTPAKGARTDKGIPKMSFGYPEPYTLTINNILFDTYETRKNVLEYIKPFQDAVDFDKFRPSDDKADPKDKERPKITKRPPSYIFTWGQEYLLCLVKTLSYKLTLFLPEGIPVRAVVSLTLQEVDYSNANPNYSTPDPNDKQRKQDQVQAQAKRKQGGRSAQ
jgi:hypothetical protein